MPSINRVMLIGNIISKPEVLETSGKKKFIKFKLQTWTHKIINGSPRKIVVDHTILVFNQRAHEFLEKSNIGTRIQLLGELSYSNNSVAEIIVSSFGGDIGPMDDDESVTTNDASPVTTQKAVTKPSPSPAMSSSAKPMGMMGGMGKPAGMVSMGAKPASNMGSTPFSAKSGGGLGKLSLKSSARQEAGDNGDGPDEDSNGETSQEPRHTPSVSNTPSNTKKNLMKFDDLDDEIPF